MRCLSTLMHRCVYVFVEEGVPWLISFLFHFPFGFFLLYRSPECHRKCAFRCEVFW